MGTIDYKIRIGLNDFSYGPIKNGTIGLMKALINRAYTFNGYFTPPDIIGLHNHEDDVLRIPDEMWAVVLAHEHLHLVLFKLGYHHTLDELNKCTAFDLDNTGLCKYTGWGGVY